MVEPLNKTQMKALSTIALRASLMPFLVQMVVGITLVILMFLVIQDPAAIVVIAALPSVLISAIVAAKLVMLKSLSKQRKQGCLHLNNPTSDLSRYQFRWAVIVISAQILAAVGFVLINAMLGVKISISGLGTFFTIMAIYYANYTIAQRMIAQGDATLELK